MRGTEGPPPGNDEKISSAFPGENPWPLRLPTDDDRYGRSDLSVDTWSLRTKPTEEDQSVGAEVRVQ